MNALLEAEAPPALAEPRARFVAGLQQLLFGEPAEVPDGDIDDVMLQREAVAVTDRFGAVAGRERVQRLMRQRRIGRLTDLEQSERAAFVKQLREIRSELADGDFGVSLEGTPGIFLIVPDYHIHRDLTDEDRRVVAGVPLPEGVPYIRCSSSTVFVVNRDDPRPPADDGLVLERAAHPSYSPDWESAVVPQGMADDAAARVGAWLGQARQAVVSARERKEQAARERKEQQEREERAARVQRWRELGVWIIEEDGRAPYTVLFEMKIVQSVGEDEVEDAEELFSDAMDWDGLADEPVYRFVSTSFMTTTGDGEWGCKFIKGKATKKIFIEHAEPECAIIDWQELRGELDRRHKERREARLRTLFARAAEIEPDEPTLIEGLLRQSGLSVVVGEKETFKTTLVMDWCLHIAYGLPWQGRKVTPRPVVYYVLENADEFDKRCWAIETKLKNGKGSAYGEGPAPIIMKTAIPDDWRAELRELTTEMREALELRNRDLGLEYPRDAPPVVVVDVLGRAVPKERGDDMAVFIQFCQRLVIEGLAEHVILQHHPTKTGDEFAGHRSIRDLAQGFYYVERKGRSEMFTLRPDVVKGMALPPPMRLETEVAHVLNRTTAIIRDKNDLDDRLAAVVEALEKLEDADAITQAQLRDALDAALPADLTGGARRMRRTRLKDELIEIGKLEPEGNVFQLVLD